MKVVFVVMMSWVFLLASSAPLQAGRNFFRPDKSSDSSSGDSADAPLSKVGSDQAKKLEQITQSLQRGNKKFNSQYYIFFLVVFILSIVLIYLLQKFYNEYREYLLDNPWSLFYELCKAHQLARLEQQLLQDIAKKQKLNNPLPIFIEPHHLKLALDEELSETTQLEIGSLLEKLFDLAPNLEEAPTSVHNNPGTTIIYPIDKDKQLS